jgi:hypothetical protein
MVAGIGIYFIILRPPLLPEDVRFIGLSAAELATVGPRLAMWLSQVFRVLGGYAFATGILAVTLAATAFRSRHAVAVTGATIAGASSIGLMTVVNFMIGSDFRWVLLACALVWGLALLACGVESYASAARRRRPTTLMHRSSREPGS